MQEANIKRKILFLEYFVYVYVYCSSCSSWKRSTKLSILWYKKLQIETNSDDIDIYKYTFKIKNKKKLYLLHILKAMETKDNQKKTNQKINFNKWLRSSCKTQ